MKIRLNYTIYGDYDDYDDSVIIEGVDIDEVMKKCGQHLAVRGLDVDKNNAWTTVLNE